MREYYFQDLCEHLQEELVGTALARVAQVDLDANRGLVLEDVDYFIDTHNFQQTIPEWFATVAEYSYDP